jgi:5'-methylthioadenosine phosphorylase
VAQAEIGVLGGSGLYQMDQLEGVKEIRIETPFGDPSDAFVLGTLAGRRVAFLPRHGRGHAISPTEINYRANIWAFKKLGVNWLIASSACGSFKEELSPGTIVVIDQLFDRTRARNENISFFNEGIVAHVQFGDPFSQPLRGILYAAGNAVAARIVDGGTYVNMEGPAFSTRAESLFYKNQGFDVIGMTNYFEARLAREAEIHFATLALVTDYDCWYEGHDEVDIDMVIKTVHDNADTFRAIVIKAVEMIPEEVPQDSNSTALAMAIITNRELITDEIKKRLEPIISKYID